MNQRPAIALGIILLLVAIGAFSYLLYSQKKDDDLLNAVYAALEDVETYTQVVTTETELSDRKLFVEGVYTNDRKQGIYSSVATTTLLIRSSDDSYTFTLSNIALPNEVFVRIDAEEGALSTTVPVNQGWTRLPADAVPQEFKDIAIPGPILDNVSIFQKSGSLLSLTKRLGEDSVFGTPLRRFEFTFKAGATIPDGPAKALYGRLEDGGTISVWVTPEDATLHHIVFSNPPYISTTSIQAINNPPPLVLPLP